MALLAGMLCRLWRCAAYGPPTRARAPENAEPSQSAGSSSDDLTAIRGIGVAAQNRLYTAGIKSYAHLARASAEEVQAILGKLAPRANIEDWIAQAENLVKKGNS